MGGREGGKEGEVEVPHLLATPSNVSDQTTAGLTIQISQFHRYYCTIQISPKLNSKHAPSPSSQTADHLESIPIFKQRLETGVVLPAEPFSLAF